MVVQATRIGLGRLEKGDMGSSKLGHLCFYILSLRRSRRRVVASWEADFVKTVPSTGKRVLNRQNDVENGSRVFFVP